MVPGPGEERLGGHSLCPQEAVSLIGWTLSKEIITMQDMYIFLIYIFIWLRRVLVAARGIFLAACRNFRCSAWALEHAGLVAPWHVGS